jgi:hypothetical protein
MVWAVCHTLQLPVKLVNLVKHRRWVLREVQSRQLPHEVCVLAARSHLCLVWAAAVQQQGQQAHQYPVLALVLQRALL